MYENHYFAKKLESLQSILQNLISKIEFRMPLIRITLYIKRTLETLDLDHSNSFNLNLIIKTFAFYSCKNRFSFFDLNYYVMLNQWVINKDQMQKPLNSYIQYRKQLFLICTSINRNESDGVCIRPYRKSNDEIFLDLLFRSYYLVFSILVFVLQSSSIISFIQYYQSCNFLVYSQLLGFKHKRMNEVVIKVIGNYSYQTSKCLGEGVYGKVYEGIERESKQKVAIKKIDLATFTNDKYLQNAIFSEIYLLKRFNHPNIVKFKDVLSSKNSLYIITEFCKNGDLKQLMKRKKFKQDEVFEIMRQILNGFSELIREKIVHRDLKPANILINEGTYKIGDFGFAKYVDNFGSQMLKSCVGSPIYMAPQILQRSPYTTKCDIWSLGVIFYEMMFGYPPWKARDQNQLLRGIKTISITHILKRSSLTTKANDFLKKTLAYSEEERIGWTDLFDMFITQKSPQKIMGESENRSIQQSSKERSARLISNSNNSWSQQQLTPQNGSISNNGFINRQATTNSSNQNQVIKSQAGNERKVFNGQAQQIQNAALLRQFCIYYHYYLVELYVQIGYIKSSIGYTELLYRLFYSLSLLIKYKSTYCISIMSIHYKNSKQLEDAYKKMKLEHETYEIIFVDIVNRLEKENLLKKIKNEVAEVIGYGDIINEEKTQKIESLMIKYTHEMVQLISDEVRKRVKNIRDISLVEILQNCVDLLSLGIGKARGLKQLKEDIKTEDEDIRDYVTKVISKLDKITANL